jgi:uncharacterized protein
MIHTYQQNGYYICVDANSSSIHLLDELAFLLIDGRESLPTPDEAQKIAAGRFGEAEIAEAHAELTQLVKDERLFTPEQSLRDAINFKQVNTALKAMCLHVAHGCNLRCGYCFAGEGDYKTGSSLMSGQTAKDAVDFLIENSPGRQSIEIDFFGGEPLLNFDVVKAAVLHAKSREKQAGKEFYFTITTNGTLLDDKKTQFINEYMDNVVISIDGRREVHDALRRRAAGGGSYDLVVPRAKKLTAARDDKSYFVRGTFTSKNLDFTDDVLHLAELGFREISIEPAVGSGGELFLREEHLPRLFAEYERLLAEYAARLSQGQNFRFYHFNLELYDAPCIFKKIIACGAGSEYVAVSPEGGIYPCHQFVGIEKFKMGSLKTGIQKPEIGRTFTDANVLTKPECRGCWAKLFCSGGCHANAYFTHNRIDTPNKIACELQKKRIECAIVLQAMTASGLCDAHSS